MANMLTAIAFVLVWPGPIRVSEFAADLARSRQEPAFAQELEAGVRKWFGRNLADGVNPKIEETTVVWALQAGSAPSVVAEDGSFRQRLERIGKSDVYAAVSRFKSADGFVFHYEVAGKRVGGGLMDVYAPDPDSLARSDVAKGTLTRMPDWLSRVFDGTAREWYVYTPANLKPDQEAALMVFQDGQGAKNYVPAVFDNLIAKGDMPPTLGIFLAPGVFSDGRSDRSFEYDTLSDQYVRFLLEEILPEVEKKVKLSHDPAKRAIAGLSSGGICAFTAAWQRPDQFGKVMSWIGSFADIAHGASLVEGGHNYPFLIRLTPKKPIRVFLQDGENDLDNQFGSWPLGNQQMARALAFAGYDYKFVYGKGNHSDRHGRAILGETLRWLWRP